MTNKFAMRPCPICNDNAVEILHSMEFVLPADFPLPRHYDVVACTRCNFVYADTPASQANYDRYYASFAKYDDPAIATGGGDSTVDGDRINDTADLIAREFADLGPDALILDVGCARGGLLQALAARGFHNLQGLDPSPACVAHLTQIGLPCTLGTLASPEVLHGLGPVDAIILSHVLEHVVAIEPALRALRAALSPAGRIYIEVSDASRYVDHPVVPFYYFDCEHINHFDGISLGNLASRHGLRIANHGNKDILLENGRSYPATWVCLTGSSQSELIPAATLKTSVCQFITQSISSQSDPALEALSSSGRATVLWGAGSFAQRLLAHSALKFCRLIAIVDRDSNKQGRQLAGIPIISPESLPGLLEGDEAIVVAAAHQGNAISKEIHALGLKNEIVLPGQSTSPP